MSKAKTGRPPKSGKAMTGVIYIRIDEDIQEAVEKFRQQEKHTTASDAARALLVKALREKSLLP